jgi:hypothetical protein
MNKILSKISIVAASAMIFVGCEAIDPLDVVNPNLSENSLVGQPNSAASWLNGLERQLAVTANNNLLVAEIASDNYVNTQTFFNQFVDNLTIDYQDDDVDDSQFHIARIREMALFGLNEIGPQDSEYDDVVKADFEFFAGLSHLMAAMYYQGLPGEAGGAVLSRDAHLDAAINYFNTSDATSANTSAKMGLVRAHYLKGNSAAAVTAADAAIAAEPDFLRVIVFDPLNSRVNSNSNNYTVNSLQDAMYDRGTFDDLQPSPKLDFLDPKFSIISGNEDATIPLFKIEEAHLVKAEAAQAAGNDAGAITILTDVIGLVATRPSRSINDAAEDRTEREPGARPDSVDITVNGRAGLVLSRQAGNVSIPSVSGTSFTAGDLAGLTGDALLEMIYDMRQEIFIGEGLRMMDMGITLVVSQNESLLNSNVTTGDTEADIPPFLAAISESIDAITYDAVTRVCTIDNDISALIVANKSSSYVCPLH